MSDEKSKTFTNPVTDSEKTWVFGKIAEVDAVIILCNFPDGSQSEIRGMEIDQNMWMVDPMANSPVTPGTRLGISFLFNQNKYLMAVDVLKVEPTLWVLSLDEKLFKVQRRNSFRADVPAQLILDISLFEIDNHSGYIKGRVKNVSMGGALLEVHGEHDPIRSESPVKGRFESPDFQDIEFSGEVRRLQVTSREPKVTVIGLQFNQLSTHGESRLNEIVMKCARLSTRYGTR